MFPSKKTVMDSNLTEDLNTRINEKQQMQWLNDRFASYIEKVRVLEQQNETLSAKLGNRSSRVTDLCEEETRKLRIELDQLTIMIKQEETARRDKLIEDKEELSKKLEDQHRQCEEAEKKISHLKQDLKNVRLNHIVLERKVKSKEEEILFLRKLHKEELAELKEQIQAQQMDVEMDSAKHDLTAALRDIRSQYENQATKNTQWSEELYKSKNESLERQMREKEDAFEIESTRSKDTIASLKKQLDSMKDKMERHLHEYKELLNVKVTLDSEIAIYRKLLDGEQNRIETRLPSQSEVNDSIENTETPETTEPGDKW